MGLLICCLPSQMNRISLFIALFSMPAMLHAAEISDYVGLVHPPSPSGLAEKGGGLVRGDSSNGLWYGFIELDGKSMVWLEREVGRIVETPKNSWPSDRPVWKVEDVLLLPAVRHGETIHQGMDIECFFKGSPDPSIIAIGKWSWRKKQVGGYARNIRLAWRLHPSLPKFESVSPQNIKCELNEDRD